MRRTRRTLFAVITAALGTAATIVGAAAPAHAASSGYLLFKGTGSVYSANDTINLGITPGTSKTWSVKVVNTGSASQQFKLNLTQDPNTPATLLVGSTAVHTPYYTAPVPAGGSLALSIKVQVPLGTPTADYYSSLSLRDPDDGTFLDSVTVVANATTQTGSKSNDLFVKTGSQPFVGGSVAEYTTASALKPGNTATFTLRLRNDGGAPTAISLDDSFFNGCASNFAVAIKQGTHDVTAAVISGGFSTGVLSPGQHVDLKLTVKLLSATACTSAYYGFDASDGVDPVTFSYAHVVTGV